MTTAKKATPKKKTPAAKTKKAAPKKKTPKAPAEKNKLGVKNSLVNNINARKKKGVARSKKKSGISKDAYTDMENNWEKDNKK